jgi:hypothetical protein
MKTGVDIVPPRSREKPFGKNSYDVRETIDSLLQVTLFISAIFMSVRYLQRSFTEVIDSALEKAWHGGDSDVFIFLLNAIKKNVISVNYQVKPLSSF